ncbi:hypothetical protein BGX38DRAFT_1269658 [Terfezia claveryi]|nr:hypothetical protein BGX38DRAFT_1269658 [Terfezia claveryi]
MSATQASGNAPGPADRLPVEHKKPFISHLRDTPHCLRFDDIRYDQYKGWAFTGSRFRQMVQN